MPKHRLSRRRRIAAAATAIAAGGVLIVAQNGAPAATVDPIGLNAAYAYLGWGDAQDPVDVMKATGLKQFTLAFLLAGEGCDPKWDGQRPLNGGQDEAKIRAIRAAGGDVVASFGGWDGTKLGEKCADSAQLAAAYQKVIDAYQLKAIDIDIEDTELSHADARQRVVDALGAVKAKNPGLRVFVTFSAELNGPDASGADLIARAAKAGVQVDGWVVMPFDFDNHPGTMVDATVSAVTGLQQTLVRAYGYDQDTAWRHSGLSSINGHSDSPDEVVSPADFRAMRDFAASHHLARFTYWAVNRDRPCAGAFTKDAASVCGGIQQEPYEFTKIVAGYHADSAPSEPTGGGSHCPGSKPSTGLTASAELADDGESPVPGVSPMPGTRLTARRAETAKPTEGGGEAGTKEARRAAATASAEPTDDGDPSGSPTADQPKHGTSRPTSPAASPSKQHVSPTAAPTPDCTPEAGPVTGPTVGPTAQPTTATPSAPSTAPATGTTLPSADPTRGQSIPTGTTTAATTTTVATTAIAAAPAATAEGDTRNGQPLASTGGGDATSMLVEGAGALLVLGGGFGMIGTRRCREAEQAR
ncbi:hypothetical protein ACFV4G_11105 [Kitasatospora sp. NPDC059747]|uniref:chitinase n=1 Tax=Kitasatospora sp. NPDC059747 TaxID=3346930 RepID=UPI0036638E42